MLCFSNGWRCRLLIIGDSPRIAEVVAYLNSNPVLGYDVVFWLKEIKKIDRQNIQQLVTENKINTIAFRRNSKKFAIIKINLPAVAFRADNNRFYYFQ